MPGKVGKRHADTRWRQSSEFNLEPGGSKAGPTVSEWEQFLKNNKKENYSKQKLTMYACNKGNPVFSLFLKSYKVFGCINVACMSQQPLNHLC